MSVAERGIIGNRQIITTYYAKQEKQTKQVTNTGNVSLKYKIQRAFINIINCLKELFNYIFRPTTIELQVEKADLPNRHPLRTLRITEITEERDGANKRY